MKNLYHRLFLVGLFMSVVSPILAQPPPPPATPVDGGLSLLLAAGGAYGLKKIFQKEKK